MYTILFLFTFTPAWLRLSRQERAEFNQSQLLPILERHSQKVSGNFYDAEAFTARCSDFAIFRCDDLRDFYRFFDDLRDTALFSHPYLQVENLSVGLEANHHLAGAA